MRLCFADEVDVISGDLFQTATGQRLRIAGIKQLNGEKSPIRPNLLSQIVIHHRIVDRDDRRLPAQWLDLDDFPGFRRPVELGHTDCERP